MECGFSCLASAELPGYTLKVVANAWETWDIHRECIGIQQDLRSIWRHQVPVSTKLSPAAKSLEQLCWRLFLCFPLQWRCAAQSR